MSHRKKYRLSGHPNNNNNNNKGLLTPFTEKKASHFGGLRVVQFNVAKFKRMQNKKKTTKSSKQLKYSK